MLPPHPCTGLILSLQWITVVKLTCCRWFVSTIQVKSDAAADAKEPWVKRWKHASSSTNSVFHQMEENIAPALVNFSNEEWWTRSSWTQTQSLPDTSTKHSQTSGDLTQLCVWVTSISSKCYRKSERGRERVTKRGDTGRNLPRLWTVPINDISIWSLKYLTVTTLNAYAKNLSAKLSSRLFIIHWFEGEILLLRIIYVLLVKRWDLDLLHQLEIIPCLPFLSILG